MISSRDILNAKILVVDDMAPNVLLIEGMLRIAGYTRVQSTTNPREVCELYRANRYDLILLDLQMPGMDGFQVMEGLKEIEGEGYLPVLVITAYRVELATLFDSTTTIPCGAATLVAKCPLPASAPRILRR